MYYLMFVIKTRYTVIICYIVSYEHAVVLYTQPVIFDQYFLTEHMENMLGISMI